MSELQKWRIPLLVIVMQLKIPAFVKLLSQRLRSSGSVTLPFLYRSPHKGGRSSPARLRQRGHRLRRRPRCLRRQYDLPPAYCAARLLPALSRLTLAYFRRCRASRLLTSGAVAPHACLLCRLIFDLPINSLLTRYASVTAPAEEKARCRAVGSAPDLRSP
jgi:hypothetical protein